MNRLKLLFALFVIVNVKVSAQSFTASHNASVQVNKLSNINITSTNSVNVPNSVDYLTGTTVSNFWTVQVDANSTWIVTINAQTATFSPDNVVPIGILSYRKNGAVNWVALTTTPTQVASGNKGPNTTSGNNFGIDLRVIPTLDYAPGTYSLNIVFTSTAQ